MAAASPDIALERGLPANLDAERFVLGAILMDDALYIQVAGALEAEDFSLEKHRRIFRRMGELHARGERIDRVTIANELLRYHELESCDGLSYLVSLDDGLPHILNLDAYIRIVKDKAVLRQMAFASQYLMNRCLMGEEQVDEILAGAEETLLRLGESRVKSGLASPRQVIDEYQGGLNAFLDPSTRVKGRKGVRDCVLCQLWCVTLTWPAPMWPRPAGGGRWRGWWRRPRSPRRRSGSRPHPPGPSSS